MLRLSLPALASHVAAGNVGATRKQPPVARALSVGHHDIAQRGHSTRRRRSRQRFCARRPCTRRLPAGENNGAPVKTATSSAQYLLDHIFVYRRDRNLPYKFSDV